jgi:hypothetical protein
LRLIGAEHHAHDAETLFVGERWLERRGCTPQGRRRTRAFSSRADILEKSGQHS